MARGGGRDDFKFQSFQVLARVHLLRLHTTDRAPHHSAQEDFRAEQQAREREAEERRRANQRRRDQLQAQMAAAKQTELRAIEQRKMETQRRIDESVARHSINDYVPTMSYAEQQQKAARNAAHAREKARVQQLEQQSKVRAVCLCCVLCRG